MRVRLRRDLRIKDFVEGSAGEVLNLPSPVAQALLRQGLAEQDRSLDGPSEVRRPRYSVLEDE